MPAPTPLHPPESVRRFTSVKVGVLLFFLLLLAFFGLNGNEADTQPQQADAGSDPSTTAQADGQQPAGGQQADTPSAGSQAGAPSGGNPPAQATSGKAASGKAGVRPGTHTESVTFQIAGHGTQSNGAAGQAAAGSTGSQAAAGNAGAGDRGNTGAGNRGADNTSTGAAGNQGAQTPPEDPSGNGMIDIQGLSAGGAQQGSAGHGAASTGAPAGKAGSGSQAASGIAGPGVADAGAGMPGGESVLHDDDAAPQPATGDSMIELPGAPSFAITQDASGAIRLTGGVPDDATRNQWMNAIRLGARDVSVNGNLRLQSVDPHAAARWEPQLTALVALMRERSLAELRVRGDVVELVDTNGSPAQARESVNLIRAQVPDGYRVALAGDTRNRAQADARNARNGAAQADARNARTGTAQTAAYKAAGDEQRKTRAQLRAEAKKAAAEKRAEAKKTAAEKRAEARRAAASGKTAAGSRASAREAGAKDGASARRLATREEAAGKSSSKTAAAGNCKSVNALSAPVYFSSNTATLTAAERRRLRNLGACLGKTAWVRVTGHADPRDSAAANQSLSERRARAVAGAIAAGGFSSARITVVGAGQTKSKAAKSKAAQQRARRVDIRVG